MTLADLTEPRPPDHELAPLDRSDAQPANDVERHWRDHGWVILNGLIPDEVIDRYCDAWTATNDVASGRSYWPACAYMHDEAILDLCLYPRLVEALSPLVGGEVALHLCLTGWRSTTRDWHQDDYLNPANVNAWYAAAWIALDDIHPDAGPFEYVDASHTWPRLRRDKIIPALGLDPADPDWPAKTEEQLTPLAEQEFERRGVKPSRSALKRGDVLVWHGCLYHRGTLPNDPSLERRVCIAHYSAKHKRTDMAAWGAHGGGYYFDQWQPLNEGRMAP